MQYSPCATGVMRELLRFGESAAPGLRARRAEQEYAEARKRIDELLAILQPSDDAPERLRQERALELLERLNTPDARAVLEDLAKGEPTANLTRRAAHSLGRMHD